MCSATLFWAHIGGVVHAAGNDKLMDLTGVGNRENFSMRQSAREVLGGQQKEVVVMGPVEEWEDRVVRESKVYWERRGRGWGVMFDGVVICVT
jgi:tRNA(Arg) A34 adenosine deaminase TadA